MRPCICDLCAPRSMFACPAAGSALPRSKERGVSRYLQQRPTLLGRGRVRIKLLNVARRCDVRNIIDAVEGRSHLLIIECGPIEAAVPLVLLDVLGPILRGADPLCSFLDKQLFDKLLDVWVKVLRGVWLLLDDIVVDGMRLDVIPRRVACKHLEDNNAERPPVHLLGVPLARDHLRGHVLWRATQGPCARRRVIEVKALCEAKVD
mmetsp:Transcript_73864/g.146870  ORF Transcript_73864/g.146870 Transcript_73864/m.146870 type:complete len:206 (-) Transcript_73864:662-1279(-)